MKKKVLAVLLLIACVCLFAGCDKVRYNAVIYNGAESEISETYKENNKPSQFGGKCFLIRTAEEYNAVFTESSKVKADFSKEMLVVYAFLSSAPREFSLVNVDVENKILEIELLETATAGVLGGEKGDGVRFTVIKLDAVEGVVSVEVDIDGD